jgi:hypothetical protein
MTRNNDTTIPNLERLIAASRRKLHDLWDAHGYTDATVLEASIELDNLLNRYYKQKVEGDVSIPPK